MFSGLRLWMILGLLSISVAAIGSTLRMAYNAGYSAAIEDTRVVTEKVQEGLDNAASAVRELERERLANEAERKELILRLEEEASRDSSAPARRVSPDSLRRLEQRFGKP